MSKITTTPNVGAAQNLERSLYTAIASGAALLLADGAANGVTGISVANWKAVLVAVAAGVLTAAKNVAINYLSSHQSLAKQVADLTAQLETLQKPPATPVA